MRKSQMSLAMRFFNYTNGVGGVGDDREGGESLVERLMRAGKIRQSGNPGNDTASQPETP